MTKHTNIKEIDFGLTGEFMDIRKEIRRNKEEKKIACKRARDSVVEWCMQ